MGEVNVKVKLTNAGDELLAQRLPNAPQQIRSLEADAVVDTGAVTLVLPSFIAQKLGLLRVGKQFAQYADGRGEEVDVTEPVYVEILGRRTSEEALVLGDEILIGQTVLEKTDLLVDCREKKLIPNPAHPNQPVLKVR
jgi:clan AA aspartic protease